MRLLFLGDTPFAPFTLAKNVTKDKLKILLDAFKKSSADGDDDDEDDEESRRDQPYLFFINGHEITSDIQDCVKHQIINAEKTVNIVYQPQAVFRYTKFMKDGLDGKEKCKANPRML